MIMSERKIQRKKVTMIATTLEGTRKKKLHTYTPKTPINKAKRVPTKTADNDLSITSVTEAVGGSKCFNTLNS